MRRTADDAWAERERLRNNVAALANEYATETFPGGLRSSGRLLDAERLRALLNATHTKTIP